MPPDDRPPQEPEAVCEGCGVRGTVGRASRHNDAGEYDEEHRFCADCWPQWSAYYRALWEERGRRQSLAWRDALDRAAGDAPPGPAWGMVFNTATWHEVLELVNKLTERLHFHGNPPSRKELAWLAAGIRDHASERVGPMPLEIRDFLVQFGDATSDTRAR